MEQIWNLSSPSCNKKKIKGKSTQINCTKRTIKCIYEIAISSKIISLRYRLFVARENKPHKLRSIVTGNRYGYFTWLRILSALSRPARKEKFPLIVFSRHLPWCLLKAVLHLPRDVTRGKYIVNFDTTNIFQFDVTSW